MSTCLARLDGTATLSWQNLVVSPASHWHAPCGQPAALHAPLPWGAHALPAALPVVQRGLRQQPCRTSSQWCASGRMPPRP